MTPATKLGMMTLPLFLAESTTAEVKSSALGEWLVIGAAVLVIVQIGWGFLDRVRGGTAQKREVSFADEYITKEDMKQAHGRITREREEIDGQLSAIRDEAKAERERLDETIKDFNERIDRVPGRVISLLRETKGLI